MGEGGRGEGRRMTGRKEGNKGELEPFLLRSCFAPV